MRRSFDDIARYRHELYSYHRESHYRDSVGPDGTEYPVDILRLLCLCDQLPYSLDCTEARESPVHGHGVFATRAISCGETVTLYPGDVVGYMPNRDRHTPDHVSVRLASDRMREKFGTCCSATFDNAYVFDFDAEYAMCGHPDFKSDANYLGHLLNDSCKPDATTQDAYSRVSEAKANCKFERMYGLQVAIVATRDIASDEELFVTYGIGYWSTIM
jgi:SET domain-containing protein